jgi:hypothetical protein
MGANIMLALGSLVMFATFLGSSNRVMIGNSQLAAQNEYYIAAVSYGQSVIDEAKTKAYQGYTVVGGTQTPSDLNGVESTGEQVSFIDTLTDLGYASQRKFDDVDDYNGYRRRVDSPRAEGYVVLASVNWVSELNPNTISATPTSYKRMLVRITSPYFPKIEKDGLHYQDTLKLSYVFAK